MNNFSTSSALFSRRFSLNFNGRTVDLSTPVVMGIINATADKLAEITQRSSENLGRLQNGFVRSYALSVLLGVVAILGYLLFK